VSDWKQKPEDQDVARAIRELPGVDADPAFRDRMRREFVEGRIEERPAGAGRMVAPARRGRWLAWAIPALAVAAVFVVIAINRAPSPRVIATLGAGSVRIDGESFPLADRAAWEDRIRPGARVETTPDATVDIRVDGLVTYEIAGGTRLTIPRSPGRWFNSAVACSVSVGELRILTTADFHGRTLRVDTPEGIAVVTGTLISVQCSDGGTCVCVLDGVAHVGVNEDDLEPVRPEYRKVMLRDGTIDIIPIEPGHRAGLVDFDARMRGRPGGQ
jgi:hypothetical protein